MEQIGCHPGDSGEERVPKSISDTKDCLEWKGDFNYRHNSQDNWEADNESNMQQDNDSGDPATQNQQNVSAVPNIPRLIWATLRAMTKAEMVLMTVNRMETWRYEGNKTK